MPIGGILRGDGCFLCEGLAVTVFAQSGAGVPGHFVERE